MTEGGRVRDAKQRNVPYLLPVTDIACRRLKEDEVAALLCRLPVARETSENVCGRDGVDGVSSGHGGSVGGCNVLPAADAAFGGGPGVEEAPVPRCRAGRTEQPRTMLPATGQQHSHCVVAAKAVVKCTMMK